jgi:hypothetical protein
MFRLEKGKLRYVHTLTHLMQTSFRGNGGGQGGGNAARPAAPNAAPNAGAPGATK